MKKKLAYMKKSADICNVIKKKQTKKGGEYEKKLFL